MKDKNSMFYWWPKVKDCDIPMPKTIMVRHEGAFKGMLSYSPLEGNPDKPFLDMIEGIKEAAREIGYPIFIRSDGTSNKHDWIKSCYVENEEQIYDHVCNILEFTAMVMFGLSFNGVAVREFLELDWQFKVFAGMPVARERRYFVRDGVVECWHPYWPPKAIADWVERQREMDEWFKKMGKEPAVGGPDVQTYRKLPEDWLWQLGKLNTPTENELSVLSVYVRTLGKRLEGYWSMDFCMARDGLWYLTDMAVGEDSYHWATCEHAPPEMLKQYGDPEAI